jgi:hypothetical protein
MLHKTIILILLMLVSLFLPAQHQTGSSDSEFDYQKFKKTYEKGVGSDTLIQTDPILHPASSPAIFRNSFKSDTGKLLAIGISDPGLERDLAIKLAMIRAKMIATLLAFPEVGILTDNYSNEDQAIQQADYASRYSDFIHIKSLLPADSSSFHVEEIEFTSFGEAIVLVSYTKPCDNNKGYVMTEANIYQNERQKQDRFDAEGKIDITCTDKLSESTLLTSTYGVISINNFSEINTIIDNLILDFSYKNYRYVADSVNSPLSLENISSTKLTYGLWKAFAERFLKSVCQHSQNEAVNIQQVDDNYNLGNQSLSRELMQSRYKFQLSDVIIYNNRLSVMIETIN